MAKTKIAIACQGGGSQTAFTAGALKALVDEKVGETFDIVGISGTSGGSLCAALVRPRERRAPALAADDRFLARQHRA